MAQSGHREFVRFWCEADNWYPSQGQLWERATNGADRAKQDGTSRQLAHVKASIRLDVVFARDRTPQSHLFADEFLKLFRAAQRERHLLCLIELLGDGGVAEGGGKLVSEPADDRLGRACGRKDAPPGIRLEPGIALGDRRHIRERRGPGLAGLCQRSDRAGLYERNGRR